MKILAPIEGTIWQHSVSVGQVVPLDVEILSLECMKMEVPVRSTIAGTIAWLEQMGVHVLEGQPVAEIQ